MDVVKHSLRTVVSALSEQDQLSIATFTDDAKEVLPLTSMSEKGKKTADEIINMLTPQASTNLWAGIETGLKTFETQPDLTGHKACMVFTDGMPNIMPPRGHIQQFQRHLDAHGNRAMLHTFGFGMSMEAQLLDRMSRMGHGGYHFIPDAGMVGTIFVNSTANMLSTMGHDAVLEVDEGLDLLAESAYQVEVKGNSKKIHLGSLQYGQSRDLILTPNSKFPGNFRAKLTWVDHLGKKHETSSSGNLADFSLDHSEVEVQEFRISAARAIQKITGKFDENSEPVPIRPSNEPQFLADISSLISDIKSSRVKDDPRIQGLLKDLEGQVTSALSNNDYFYRWGTRYLPSLSSAHLRQVCNNFKDPGVQLYGGKLFEKIRDQCDEIFLKIPQPKPTRRVVGGSVLHNMSYFYNSNNPCFHGDCYISMETGQKLVKEIKKGDRVMTRTNGRDHVTQVLCVIETRSVGKFSPMVVFPENGLVITPFHPMKLNSTWEFPRDVRPVIQVECDRVFSFVLKDGPVIFINQVECVTFGHGLNDSPVVSHPYFGTDLIIQDFKQMSGWESGKIQLEPGCLVRDPETKLVCKIVQRDRMHVE
eukprot:TRINITY_DN5546_c0_g1_i4.p1 TRINITY_DN5546_c0_g1~~TRINITY_DN5546_c0_g1_i4.p1  ORF type:complete len:690 (+),score=213.65 TRINITY_DN5546_c0_g1_i4:303-2072(+)